MTAEHDTLLVTGSRTWDDEPTMRAWLERMRPTLPRLVHGAARGADRMAGQIGRALGFEVNEYPVNERVDGPWPAAGHRRNARMVHENAARIGRVCAFTWIDPSAATTITAGTAHCVSVCLYHALPIILVAPGALP